MTRRFGDVCSNRPLTLPPRGFTMVEILLVMVLVGVLLAIALPLYERFIEKARVTESVVQIGTIATRIQEYQAANGALPADLTPLQNIPTIDPWGRAYMYVIITSPGVARRDKKTVPINSQYDLFSVGRDGLTHNSLGNDASRDDVIRARDGRFIGLAEEFDP